MNILSILIVLNAVLHIWFLILEMFLWTGPIARKSFGMSQQLANDTATLAKNQGLYNGFLAAGLLYSLITTDPNLAHSFQVFFLGCMVVAGLYGALTANIKILFIQALPAAITLGLLLLHS